MLTANNDGSPTWQAAAAATAFSGTLPVANGGTGAATFAVNNLLLGNGTSGLQAVAPGTTGNILTSDGTTWTSAAAVASGIPYTGATGAVDFGLFDLTVNEITLGKGSGNQSFNIALGVAALSSASQSGNNDIGIGFVALQNNTTGENNTATGTYSLLNNTTGNDNTAAGINSLSNNSSGSNLTALGSGANVASDGLINATAIGAGAQVAASNTIQLGNTGVTNVITSGTLTAGAVTYPNIVPSADGQVLTANTDGSTSWTTASGGGSGIPYTGATGAVDLGAHDLTVNTITVGLGLGAVYSNTAIGMQALFSNTLGGQNTANGYKTLYSNIRGSYNTANGYQALYSNTYGDTNTAVGYHSLFSNTLGGQNTANGFESLSENTTGRKNTASGVSSLSYNTTGNSNTASGFEALSSNLTGSSNAAIGTGSLLNNTNGSLNTAMGDSALVTNTTGRQNTALGYAADVSSAALTNATAIGYGASVAASNTIQLGNTNVTTIGGQVSWTAASDIRLKKNITNTKYGLATVLKLRAVDYNLISNNLPQVGFIAQEVKKLVPEVVTGKEGDLKKGEILGITYANLVPVLARAIQEQQKEIDELKKLVELLLKNNK